MKRKVILYISQSLDGYIADSQGKVDWICGNEENYDGDYGYSTFVNTVDTIIMGYLTYHQIVNELSADQWVYDNQMTYVLTHRKISDLDHIKFVNIDVNNLIGYLKRKQGRHIWICGGANIIKQCLEKNLIDEFQIATVPVLLGSGIRLFDCFDKKVTLKLVASKQEKGLILSRYIKTS